jgi:hypothetical protein
MQDEVLLYYIKKFLRESAEDTITRENARIKNSRASKRIAKAKRVIQILNKI